MTAVVESLSYACLAGAPTVRVLGGGCSVGCTFCYQRGYESDPVPPGEELDHLIDRLQAEWGELLEHRRRDGAVPKHALVQIHADAFPPVRSQEEATLRVFKALLERRVGISFITKGGLTRRLLELIATHQGRIRGRVVLTTLDPAVSRRLEPGAASPQDRLNAIAALADLEALADVRLDPLVPGLTDTRESLRSLLEALAARGATSVTASYLHLRPAIVEELEELLPEHAAAVVRDAYHTQPWVEVGTPTKVKLLPKDLRDEGHRRLRRAAAGLDIAVRVCQCKNPDLGGDPCGAPEGRLFPQEARGARPPGRARTLFPC